MLDPVGTQKSCFPYRFCGLVSIPFFEELKVAKVETECGKGEHVPKNQGRRFLAELVLLWHSIRISFFGRVEKFIITDLLGAFCVPLNCIVFLFSISFSRMVHMYHSVQRLQLWSHPLVLSNSLKYCLHFSLRKHGVEGTHGSWAVLKSHCNRGC